MEKLLYSVSDFIALTNQTLEYAYPTVTIEGEVSSYKESQGKWVYFDLKDDGGAIRCFTSMWNVRQPIEDGMKLIITASPKLSTKGYFSLTIKSYRLVGEGTIKKSFELLKAKLDAEGLFATERKRILPTVPKRVGVISSTEAAGYADFIKILDTRWGGLKVDVAHVQVQGMVAPDQMIRALEYFNAQEELPEVIVIIRGGGSADDLAAFNDELLVRAIAGSRVPTLVGVGHEVDVSLADLAADVRAATPTDAARILVPDKKEMIATAKYQTSSIRSLILQSINQYSDQMHESIEVAFARVREKLGDAFEQLATLRLAVGQLNPENVLRRGYALVRGEQSVGSEIEIETQQSIMKAEVKSVRQK